MRPIVLIADSSRSESLRESFSELSFNIDAIYSVSEAERVVHEYFGALFFMQPGKPEAGLEARLIKLLADSDNFLVILLDEPIDKAGSCYGDDVFGYLNLPLNRRELEMLVCYYEKIQAGTGLTGRSGKDINPAQEPGEQYRKLFDSMSMVAVQGYTEKREIIFWNRASEILYGYSREEALGRKLEDLIIPDLIKRKTIDEISNFVHRDIGIPASELVLKRKDGSNVHVFSSHILFPGSNGGKEIYSVDLDLSQIKRHQQIQEVLSKIATATNTSDDLQDFLRTLQDSLSRIINTRNFFIALYNEDDISLSLPIFIDDIDQFRTFPAGRTLTAYMIGKNKPLLLREAEMAALEDQNIIDMVGSPCKLWLGVPLRRGDKVMGAIVLQSYTDDKAYDETDMRILQIVSEQISIAIDRKSRQEQLRESERAMKTLISNLPGIAYRCKLDKYWTMEFLSDGFSILTGYEINEFIDNRKYRYADLIHPDDKKEVIDKVGQAVSSNEPYHLIYRVTTSVGEVRWVWEKGRAVSDSIGNMVALEGFIIDITDRIEMEEQIISAKEKAEESDRLKSAFLANLSHEIRSPMNSIVGFSQLLKAEKVDEPVHQYVDIILQSSQSLLDVINDIVDMAKVDSGTMPVIKREFYPGIVIESMKNLAKEQLQYYQDKQIVVLAHTPPVSDNVSLFSDETLVRKVLIHLVNNAVKFTETGRIDIGFEIDSDNIFRFFVRDTGIGISSLNQKLVFERFRQVDDRTTRKFDGTGLGLSISWGIAGLLGGNLWVESSEGIGSEFYFTVPDKQL